VLSVRGIDVFYGRVQALRRVDLAVSAGELVTIVGPNGSGKTTLLRAITGLVPIRTGTIAFEGEPIGGFPTEDIVRRGIGLVPEGRDLFGPLTVDENLRLGAYRLPRAVRTNSMDADLARVLGLFPPLEARLSQPVSTLSGGEQQMVAIGRALMARPKLLLLDEPSVGLAPLVIREIFRALASLKAEGLTILLVEQNARAALRIADRAFVLEPGGIIAAVAPDGQAADVAREAYGLDHSRGDPDMHQLTVNERLPREELERLQLAALRKSVAWASERVPLYRERLRAAGVRVEDLTSIADVRRLPFTQKSDFRDTYPFGLFAVPIDQVIRLHASSGTTGKPTLVGYTRRDIDTWSDLMARVLLMGGVGPSDVVQNAYGYGLFTGGLGFHYGAERVGAAVIPISGGFTDRQLMCFTDFGASVLCSTPSYALHLAEALEDAGISAKTLKLRVGFFGAEPWTEGMRQALEARLNIIALNIYGLSEVMGPGVSVECLERAGMHVAEDHFLVEIIDPATLEPLPPGSTGELVVTALTKEALPVLRYRTRDLTTLDKRTCGCGRTLVRMGRIVGRSDDMLIIRGVNVYPSQIEHVLTQLPQVEPHYLLVVRRDGTLDTLEVQVEARADVAGAGPDAMRGVGAQVKRRIHELIGLTADVTVVPPRTIERSIGKAKRVQDLRPSGV
jgi:phenylacetate-CoA ligase